MLLMLTYVLFLGGTSSYEALGAQALQEDDKRKTTKAHEEVKEEGQTAGASLYRQAWKAQGVRNLVEQKQPNIT